MFINFNEVEVLKSVGIDYFSSNREDLINMNESELELHNEWTPYCGNEGGGADVVCHYVHIGKKLEGNKNRLRIAVYDINDRMGTVILFQVSQHELAIKTMFSLAGYDDNE